MVTTPNVNSEDPKEPEPIHLLYPLIVKDAANYVASAGPNTPNGEPKKALAIKACEPAESGVTTTDVCEEYEYKKSYAKGVANTLPS